MLHKHLGLAGVSAALALLAGCARDRKSTRLNSSHSQISYAVFCLKKKKTDSTVTLTTVNPLGVKGVGEAGTIGSTPAVANAIADALGVAHVDMPFTSEKMWKILQQQQQQQQ